LPADEYALVRGGAPECSRRTLRADATVIGETGFASAGSIGGSTGIEWTGCPYDTGIVNEIGALVADADS
jgi:hypothetical protein